MIWNAIIASTKRAEILDETIRSLQRQSFLPKKIIISVIREEDVLASTRQRPDVIVIQGEAGLPRQLNRALKELTEDCEGVAIFDDDVELAEDYLEEADHFFHVHRDIPAFDGKVLKDGDVTRKAAGEILQSAERSRDAHIHRALYGCNMMIRRRVFEKIKFDENLPLYGLYFDLAFSRECQKLGPLYHVAPCRIVHLKVATGRMNDCLFGYFQMVNPVYLWKKGLIHNREMVWVFLIRGFVSNIFKVLRGESAGLKRLKGNLIGMGDMVKGHIDPTRGEKLK